MEAAYRGEPIEESMNPEILEKHDISVKIEILGKQNWMKDLIRPPEQGINKNITYILAHISYKSVKRRNFFKKSTIFLRSSEVDYSKK